ncbi:MAG: hypothetical protein EXQ74_03110 [Thermoleophilia bacterium]|nr:hypothetical protein [Thermoleophilia bacterium]
MTTEIVRQFAAVAAAVGLLLMLLPTVATDALHLPDRPRRLVGLGVILVAWVVMAATLAPSGVTDPLSTPMGLMGGIIGAVVVMALVVVAGRLLAPRPWVWFLLLGLTLPVRIPISVGGEDANLLLPLYVVIVTGITMLWWMERRGARERRWPTTPLDLPLGAFVAFTLISVLWSSDPFEGAIKATFFWIPFVLAYLVIVTAWHRGRAAATLAITTMAMAVPVALLAVAQYLSHDVFWNHRLIQANVYSRFFRVNSIFYDPNILGRYLVLALIIAVAVAWTTRARTTVLVTCGALAIVYSAALVVTFSRSSALMLMVGLLILALHMFGARRTLLVGLGIVTLGSGIAIAGSSQVRSALTSTARLDKVSEGRFDLVSGGVDLFRQHPVAGGGLGSFAADYSASLSTRDVRTTRVLISHNAPVTVLTEEGVIGGALFAWVTVLALIVGVRTTRDRGSGSGVPGVAMLAGLVGVFMHALLYSALFEDPYSWVLAAGLMALAARTAGKMASVSETVT